MTSKPSTAQYFGLELFRGKPLSKHLAYVRQQIAAIMGSDLEFDDQTRIELETLEIAFIAYVNRAKKMERVQPNRPLVSWKRLLGWRYLPANSEIHWNTQA
jgi:hypothetical protein